jgi:ParB family chromosome partitioning protein
MQKRIPLALIYGNPDQPRKTFEPGALAELAASIRENGLAQPITVRPDDAGKFMIVMGERRFRAHQLLAERDPKSWPDLLCMVSKVDDMQLAVNAIIENDQRVDVAPLEQARSYQRMIDLHGFNVDTLAIKLGKPVRRIRERLDLLGMSEESQLLFEQGHINPTQAWHLSKLDTRQQAQLVRAINAGQCRTNEQLYAICEAMRDEGAQNALFDMAPVGPTDDERKRAAGFEDQLNRIAATLRASIDDQQTVTAVRRVDPGRASTIADLIALMAVDFRRLETAFRVAAAGSAMTEVEA